MKAFGPLELGPWRAHASFAVTLHSTVKMPPAQRKRANLLR